jgi:hypothetical protein
VLEQPQKPVAQRHAGADRGLGGGARHLVVVEAGLREQRGQPCLHLVEAAEGPHEHGAQNQYGQQGKEGPERQGPGHLRSPVVLELAGPVATEVVQEPQRLLKAAQLTLRLRHYPPQPVHERLDALKSHIGRLLHRQSALPLVIDR